MSWWDPLFLLIVWSVWIQVKIAYLQMNIMWSWANMTIGHTRIFLPVSVLFSVCLSFCLPTVSVCHDCCYGYEVKSRRQSWHFYSPFTSNTSKILFGFSQKLIYFYTSFWFRLGSYNFYTKMHSVCIILAHDHSLKTCIVRPNCWTLLNSLEVSIRFTIT